MIFPFFIISIIFIAIVKLMLSKVSQEGYIDEPNQQPTNLETIPTEVVEKKSFRVEPFATSQFEVIKGTAEKEEEIDRDNQFIDFSNRDELKKAIIASEIFNRKY